VTIVTFYLNLESLVLPDSCPSLLYVVFVKDKAISSSGHVTACAVPLPLFN